MEIKLQKIKIKDLYKGFSDGGEDGVFAYNKKLSVRPPYQREFIYKPTQQANVIHSILHKFPLNVMYWVKTPKLNTFELLDGQQRTMSICNYIHGDFSIAVNGNQTYYHSLPQQDKNIILNYDLNVYFCEGDDKEKIEWFEVINTGTAILMPQEILNAIYSGTWVTSAKKYFSKTNCPAYQLGNRYLSGSCIRQDYLETIIKWVSKNNISGYMSQHQNENDASDLIVYFNRIIDWINATFEYRREMSGLDWGKLYDKHHTDHLNKNSLEIQIAKLMEDEEIENKKGIYAFVLTSDEKHLSLRQFTKPQKTIMYERQRGVCPICRKHFPIEAMDAHHIQQWNQGGKTEVRNGKMICKTCHHNSQLHDND